MVEYMIDKSLQDGVKKVDKDSLGGTIWTFVNSLIGKQASLDKIYDNVEKVGPFRTSKNKDWLGAPEAKRKIFVRGYAKWLVNNGNLIEVT